MRSKPTHHTNLGRNSAFRIPRPHLFTLTYYLKEPPMNPTSTTTSPLFIGCATALVTPFRGGEVDRDAYVSLVRRQLAAAVDALVICGTTGESPTLSDKEKEWLFTTAVNESRRHAHDSGRAPTPVIAGTGSNNTSRAVILSRLAADCGCDGLLVVTPYYNKASDTGLVRHYETVADATPLPLILYHVPARTGCRMTPAVVAALAEHPRIVGLKDATGDLTFTARVRAACGEGLAVYAGNDAETVPVLSLGGQGVISVVSNLFPARMTRLCRLFFDGHVTDATREQLALLPLCDALFSDVNPIPVKYALSRLGLCSDELRLPLSPAAPHVRESINEALSHLPAE